MGDEELERALKLIYQPPKPQGREDFLKGIETPQMTMLEFFLSQVGYIRPWGWLLSLGIFAAALRILWRQPPQAVWMVAALLPFAALSTVMELNRSARYQMEELELAARFSLRAVILARMSILGFGNLLLLAVLGPLVMKWTGLPLVETGFYMLCPYCLTAVLCLVILRRRRHGENLYLCAGAAVAVSLLFGLADRFTVLTRTISSAADHAGLSLLLLALMVWEYRKYLANMEEYAWN